MQRAHQLRERTRLRPARDPGVDLGAIALPVRDLAPLALAGQLRLALQLRQAREDLVGRAGNGDPLAVLGGVMAVRHDIDGAGTHALAHIALVVVGRGQLVEDAEDRLVQADVDELPAPRHVARAQREHDAERAVEPRHVVGNGGGAGRHRRPVGIAREVRQPAEGVADAAEAGTRAVGPGLAEAGDAHHHQLGVLLAEDIPAEAPLLHGAGLEILDQDIGLRHQPLQDRGALGLAQVERRRLLVAALLQPGQRVAVRGDGAELAERIADLRQLELDHLGAELGQLRRAERAGEKARHVDDADALHRLDGRMRRGRGCVGHDGCLPCSGCYLPRAAMRCVVSSTRRAR